MDTRVWTAHIPLVIVLIIGMYASVALSAKYRYCDQDKPVCPGDSQFCNFQKSECLPCEECVGEQCVHCNTPHESTTETSLVSTVDTLLTTELNGTSDSSDSPSGYKVNVGVVTGAVVMALLLK